MNLEHEFTVPVPVDAAWPVLLDVERVAPCMPGATLTSVDGDTFTGTVKVKVGPVQMTYKGEAAFTEKDSVARRAVVTASGKETRGGGTAGATVTITPVADGDSTRVTVSTDLNITGRPAQFGRGVLSDVAGKLIDQFSTCLAEQLTNSQPAAAEPVAANGTAPAPDAASAHGTASAQAPEPTPARAEAEPIDLLDVAGASVAKRLAPVAALVAFLVLVLVIRRRRR